jgi:uncharacterized protein (UPF0335 family)
VIWRNTVTDKSFNPINGKSLDDLFKTTQEKIDEIKDQGYDVKQMWESKSIKKEFTVPFDVKQMKSFLRLSS